MSCSTNATRSAGASVSSTTSKATPTESASSSSRSGSGVESAPAPRDQIGHVALGRLLAPGLARAQHVQADARHHRRQPAAEVVDRAAVGSAEPQPGLLNGVVRLTDGAQHPMGHPAQVIPMGFEPVDQVPCNPFSNSFSAIVTFPSRCPSSG